MVTPARQIKGDCQRLSMPYLFVTTVQYSSGKYTFTPTDLISKFPYLQGAKVFGRIVSTIREGRTIRINEDFQFKIDKTPSVAEILELNPLKRLGFPLPSEVLLVVYKYEEGQEPKVTEFPIMETGLLKGASTPAFEDEIKRILKEQESGILLEGTFFHKDLEKCKATAKEALISFEQENFPPTKTSCRRIVETIKSIVGGWKTVDGSKSLCEKLQGVVNSSFSFASIGGPHEGVATREETEFLLKTTMSLLLYCNSILKGQRATTEASKI